MMGILKKYSYLLLAYGIVIVSAFFFIGLVPAYAETWGEGFENCNVGESWEDCSVRVYGSDYEDGNLNDFTYASTTPTFLGVRSMGYHKNGGHTLPISEVLTGFDATTSVLSITKSIYIEPSLNTTYTDQTAISAGTNPIQPIRIKYEQSNDEWDVFDFDEATVIGSIQENTWYTFVLEVNCIAKTINFTLGSLTSSDTFNYCEEDFWLNQNHTGLENWSVYEDNFVVSDLTSTSTVEIVPFPESDGEVSIGSENYVSVNNRYCIVGEECDLIVRYSYEAIEDTITIYNSNILNENVSFFASSTLPNSLLLKLKVPLAIENTPTNKYYNVYVEGVNDWIRGVHIEWIEEDIISELGLEYDIDGACDTVASSTGSTWDDFRYGIECAFRKIVYWSFVPRPQAYLAFQESVEDFKGNFPLSVAYDIKRMFGVIEEFSVPVLEIPLIWYEQDGGLTTLATLEVSSSTIYNTPGMDKEKYERFYNAMETIIYILGLFWLLSILIKLVKED